MRSSSRILLVLLAALTSFAYPSTPASARPVNSFVDDDNSRFEPFIETAKESGLVAGCNPPANDRVCPHQLITRGNMAIMVARALGVSAKGKDHFTDDNGHPAESSINGITESGVLMGCEKGQVCPNRLITRGEMAAMIARAFPTKAKPNPGKYSDIADSAFKEPLSLLAAQGGLMACDQPTNQRLCPDSAVQKDEAVYAVVSVMGLDAVNTTPRDNGLAPIGFGDGFDELSLWDGRAPSSRNRVRLTDGGYQDTALRVSIPKGSHYGADFALHLEDAVDDVPEQLFFRYYVNFDEDWIATSHGKLPGFSGVYGSSGKGGSRSRPSEPGWSARMMFSPNHGSDSRIDLGYYVYHLGQETKYGDGLDWNQAGELWPGEWYCLEGEVDLNTLGLADGALRAWVDETPAFDLSGLEFRRPNEPQIKIESFWVNVYYGGKSVAPQDLGLTIDEVIVDTKRIGCGEGPGTKSPTDGDFNGDGYSDRTWWGECPGGTCFWTENQTWSGTASRRQNGNGAWFTLDTHRVGLATGDVDGDGRTDIVYHGRCENSMRCWRVHDARDGMTEGANWGDDARFSPRTTTLVLGDWNGDGTDDLVYSGLCGEKNQSCWRVHRSSGKEFVSPEGWGTPPAGVLNPQAADIDGDRIDDLVYQAPCDESMCWFAQISTKDGFKGAVALGPTLESADNTYEWIDFDGEDGADLVSWANGKGGSWIEVRYSRGLRLTDPVNLASLGRRINDVAMRRLPAQSTVQAVVQLACGEGKTCIRRFMSPTMERFVDSDRFRDERWDRPGAPRIT
jgi:hypothetical protein